MCSRNEAYRQHLQISLLQGQQLHAARVHAAAASVICIAASARPHSYQKFRLLHEIDNLSVASHTVAIA
jgi:hypothetical protein